MAEPSAIRLYVPDHPELLLTVQRRLQKMHDELASQVSDGYAADWADYKHRIGMLRGLSLAIDMCRQQFEELTK